MDLDLLYMAIAGAFVALAGAPAILRGFRAGRAWQDQVKARWSAIAEALGATLEVEGKGMEPHRLRLSVEDEEGAVACAQVTVPSDRETPTHTRAWARYVLGYGPHFVLRRDRRNDGLEEAIESEESEATVALFTEAARAQVEALRRPFSLRADGQFLELTWDGLELAEDVLGAALALLRELSLASARALRELAELEGAAFESREDGARVRVRRERAEVELSMALDEDAVVFVARAEARNPLPEFETGIDADGSLDGEVPDGVIDPAHAGELASLGSSRIRGGDERLEIVWSEPPGARAAEAAVRILAAVAKDRGSQGVFR